MIEPNSFYARALGVLVIGFDVLADGTVANVHIVRPSGAPDFDDSMVACFARQSRYTPQILDGVAVESRGYAIRIPIMSGVPVP